MKIRIETDAQLAEPELIIRCRTVDDEVMSLQAAALDALKQDLHLVLLKDGKEYLVPPETVLFFEAVDGKTYAHTAQNIFTIKARLYELERTLPAAFIRASKSSVINTARILAITRNLAGPSLVQFRGSHKRISVSRSYFKQLQDKLNERSLS